MSSPLTFSPEEMKTKMDAKHAELEAWAKQNGIDPQYVMPKIVKFHKMGAPGEFGQGKQDQHFTVTHPTQ